MEISGVITEVKPMESGTNSQTGNPWRKVSFMLEYDPQSKYPKKAAFTLMNERYDKYMSFLSAGMPVKVSFDLSSREYNGRYYTDAMAWKIEPSVQVMSQQPMPDYAPGYGVQQQPSQPVMHPQQPMMPSAMNQPFNIQPQPPQPAQQPAVSSNPLPF